MRLLVWNVQVSVRHYTNSRGCGKREKDVGWKYPIPLTFVNIFVTTTFSSPSSLFIRFNSPYTLKKIFRHKAQPEDQHAFAKKEKPTVAKNSSTFPAIFFPTPSNLKASVPEVMGVGWLDMARAALVYALALWILPAVRSVPDKTEEYA